MWCGVKYDRCACGKRKRSCAVRCSECHLAQKRVPATTCPDCGTNISRNSIRCRPCADIHRRRPRLQPNGYVMVHERGHPLADSRGRVLEHRKVVFDAGIAIPPGYHIHHLNHDRSDNRLGNLAVLPSSEHVKRHVWGRGWVRNQFGVFPVQEHSMSAYRRGCRCAVCTKANTDYCREVARRRREREAA